MSLHALTLGQGRGLEPMHTAQAVACRAARATAAAARTALAGDGVQGGVSASAGIFKGPKASQSRQSAELLVGTPLTGVHPDVAAEMTRPRGFGSGDGHRSRSRSTSGSGRLIQTGGAAVLRTPPRRRSQAQAPLPAQAQAQAQKHAAAPMWTKTSLGLCLKGPAVVKKLPPPSPPVGGDSGYVSPPSAM